MLQNQLEEIKGRLLDYVFTMYKDMNSDENGVDYKMFYEEIQSSITEIRGINNLSLLERFCEDYGLNDIGGELSFLNLVEKAYK
jgi:hypothetical protein